METEVIRQALMEASKLGYKGLQVVDFIEPEGATEDNRLRLVVTSPKLGTASDGSAWD